MQRTVFLPVIGLDVRGAAADQVEGDNPEFFIERRRQIAPHALVAAESVREQHGDGAVAMDLDVIALLNCHADCALIRGFFEAEEMTGLPGHALHEMVTPSGIPVLTGMDALVEV
jgi:hypothetical protein